MNALRCKIGVRFDRIAPAGFRIIAALQMAVLVFERDLTITCGTEGHGPDDPHSTGDAYDVRTRGLTDAAVLETVGYLKQQLGPAFTVLYEAPTRAAGDLGAITYVNTGASAPHLHIQRKAGTKYPS